MNEPYCRCAGCGECSAHRKEPKLKSRIEKLEAEIKGWKADQKENLRNQVVLHQRVIALEAALDVALEALETYFNQYPHMQKGYTLDAIEILKEVRRD